MSATRIRGTCNAVYCFDIGRGIDLNQAQQTLASSRRTRFQHKIRSSIEGGRLSHPLRLTWSAGELSLDGHEIDPEVEISVYDLGVLSINWRIPFEGELEELVGISVILYDNAELTGRSRTLAEELGRALGDALDRPRFSPHVEDYVVFRIGPGPPDAGTLLEDSRATLARVLRAEEGELSRQEIDDALSNPTSYGPVDVCLVDWLAAFMMGEDLADELQVLELATVELLQLRILDSQLDGEVREAFQLLTRPRGPISALVHQRQELEHLGRIQTDDALLHEGIDNALKLFGDDYLARLYRTAATRFHFDDWDTSIQRKLGVLRSVYQNLADSASHRRSEALEWVIILLIAADILLLFTPWR